MKMSNSKENILEHLPPLGLTLTKTTSLVNLIEESLSKEEANGEEQARARGRSYYDRPKASNFRAKMIKIGSWEVVAQNESQLVAKCYYAKKKLVWEVMENGLKSKMEIQWSDISAIKATMIKDQDGILELELSMPPTFSREHVPQAGKHSSWYPCQDFTGGQASIHRRHYVRFPSGLLDKPFRILTYHDVRIFEMSHKPFPSCSNPCFTWNPADYTHYMNEVQAQTQVHLDNLDKFSITNIHGTMTINNELPGAETTMQNAPSFAYCPPQLLGNNLAFGEQVVNQFPEEPVSANPWNFEISNFTQVIPTKDSNSPNDSDSQYYLNPHTNILNVNDYTGSNNQGLTNLGQSQRRYLENFLGVSEEGHHNSNNEVLANPRSLQANSIDGQSYQQPPISNPIQFFDSPNQMMDQCNYSFVNTSSYYSSPGGQLNVLGNYPCDMVYNQMGQWNRGI